MSELNVMSVRVHLTSPRNPPEYAAGCIVRVVCCVEW